jgi:hypothetical protein
MDIWYTLWTFGILYGHLVYFMDMWYILWTFGIFCGNFVHFKHIGMLYHEKAGNPVVNYFKQGYQIGLIFAY